VCQRSNEGNGKVAEGVAHTNEGGTTGAREKIVTQPKADQKGVIAELAEVP